MLGSFVCMPAHLPTEAAMPSSGGAPTTLVPPWILARLSCLWDPILGMDKVHPEKRFQKLRSELRAVGWVGGWSLTKGRVF